MATDRHTKRLPALADPLAGALGGLLLALCVLWSPLLAFALCILGLALAATVSRSADQLADKYGRALLVSLLGYLFLGKAFSYLGAAPVFIGEVLLAFGLFTLLVTRRLPGTLRSVGTWWLLALAISGIAQTIPYLGRYGVLAVRDAALYGYAAFAVISYALLRDPEMFRSIARGYDRALLPFLISVPVVGFIHLFASKNLPVLPGTLDVTLPFIKFGDAAVHLAGACAFVASAGLADLRVQARPASARPYLLWGLIAVGMAMIASQTRGGFLSIAVAMLLVFLALPWGRQWRIVPWLAAGLAAWLLFAGSGSEGSHMRSISPQQILRNVESMVGVRHQTGGNLSGTAEWRMRWWDKILDYTFDGPYFWTGKGYGINLATADGFDVDEEKSLRSPHNAHLTLLARSGVPGFSIWIGFFAWLGLRLLRAFRSARLRRDPFWCGTFLWLAAYASAALVNASFDVYLEGPHGGIPFWCLCGAAMRATELELSGALAGAVPSATSAR